MNSIRKPKRKTGDVAKDTGQSTAISIAEAAYIPERSDVPLSLIDGPFEVRLARDESDLHASQALRYHVFYEEMAATPDDGMRTSRRDVDPFDDICDHLLVVDHSRGPEGEVIGTYRLLRQEIAERHGGFYSADEFDISPLLAAPKLDGGLMELGRSCVHRDYRNNATIQLLWRGIAAYILTYRISAMFGCASFRGTDPNELALPLSYLYHNHLTPPERYIRALPDRYVSMNILAADEIDQRAVLKALPPLIKGYLRLGCYIGDGAVIDYQFGTTDVFILLPVERIPERYYLHFDRF